MPLNVPFYTDKYIEDRWVELYSVFCDFRDAYQEQVSGVRIHLDETKLFLAVVAYFHDVARYKWWHYRNEKGGPETALLQPTKKAAFISYWINKISPIYVVKPTGTPRADVSDSLPPDVSVMANVHFSITVGLLYLDYCFSEKVLAKLIYQMLWREDSPRASIVLFEILEDVIKGDEVFLKRSLGDFGKPD